MMELDELEELIKSVNRKSISAFLRNAAIVKNPNASPEMKELAQANLKAISENKPRPTPKTFKPSSQTAAPAASVAPAQPSNLEGKKKVNALSSDKVKGSNTVKGAIDLVHQLHSDGDTDSAHKLLSAIPKEHLPAGLKDYNPAYIHYNVSPAAWQALPPEHQEHVHGFHNEVMTGVHNDSPHPEQKAMALKVQNLSKPNIS